MATSEPSRIRAPEPPKDLDDRELPTENVRQQTWWRLHDRGFSPAVHWSRAGKYRFDSQDTPFGVCYAAQDIATAFLEVFGDKVRRSRRLALSQINRYEVCSLEVAANLKVLTLAGHHLVKIGATLGCFTGSYPLSQRWGMALMKHPDQLDGLVYLGRRSGARCLALFGDDQHPKAHQGVLTPTPHGSLADSLEFWQLADQLELEVF